MEPKLNSSINELQLIIYEAICQIENGETDISKIYNTLIKVEDLKDKQVELDVANEYLGQE